MQSGLRRKSASEHFDGRALAGGMNTGRGRDLYPYVDINTSGQPIKALYNNKGQECGEMIPGFCLRKRIRGSDHILRTPRAIAFDADLVQLAREHECREVWALDTETSTLYRISLADFWDSRIVINRGWGLQWAALLTLWQRIDLAGRATIEPLREPEPVAAELGLW